MRRFSSRETLRCIDENGSYGTGRFKTGVCLHEPLQSIKSLNFLAVKEYMPRLEKHYRILISIFTRHAASGEPVNATQSFTYLGLDLISELTFGKSFELLRTGRTNVVTKRLVGEKKIIGFALIITWCIHLIRAFTPAGRHDLAWYKEALEKRKRMDVQHPDLYTHLSQSDTWEFDCERETRLAIVAGSDTVAITLTNICWFLSSCPEYQNKLYTELVELPDKNGLIDDQLLIHNPLLLGIINEALRLQPAVPSGVQRVTPPEGAVIAGRYIPGNIVITTPTYSLHRGK